MMDQQNLEAPQPASADPAVALAEMLGQLPKAAAEKGAAVEVLPLSQIGPSVVAKVLSKKR